MCVRVRVLADSYRTLLLHPNAPIAKLAIKLVMHDLRELLCGPRSRSRSRCHSPRGCRGGLYGHSRV